MRVAIWVFSTPELEVQSQRGEGGIDDAALGQQDLPCEDPQNVAGPERRDGQEQRQPVQPRRQRENQGQHE